MTDPRSPDPAILVTGLARSGTTWLAKLFDSHPSVVYRHEPDRPPLFPKMPILAGAESADTYRLAVRKFAAALPMIDRVRSAGTLPVFRKRGEGFVRYQVRRAANLAVRIGARRLGNIRVPFADRPVLIADPECADLARFQGRYLVWKSVWSAGRLGCLLNTWPKLCAVLLLRDPCGIIESRRRGVAQGRIAPVYHEEFRALVATRSPFVEQLLRTHQLQTTADWKAFRWAVINSHAIESISESPGSVILRYEDLTKAPEETLRSLFNSVGLSWDRQVERFLRSSRRSTSNRYYSLHRKATAVDMWRSKIDPAERDRIYEIVADTPAGRLYAPLTEDD